MRLLEGHIGQVLSLAYSPDGLTLASGDAYQQVRLWDVGPGTERALLRPRRPRREWDAGVRGLAFQPDGRSLATAAGRNEVSFWGVASGARLRELTGHQSPVRAVAFAADGALVSGSRGGGWLGGEAIVWDGGDPPQPAHRVDLPQIWSLAVSTDGQTVALGTNEGLCLWTPRETPGAPIQRRRFLRTEPEPGRSRDLRQFETKGVVTSVALSPDGRLLAAAEEWVVGVWEVAGGRRLASLEGHAEPVQAVAFHPDGRTLASASQDGTLRLWDIESLAESACFDAEEGWLNAVAFDPGGMTVAVAAEEDIIIWDLDMR